MILKKFWRSFRVNRNDMILIAERILYPANTIHSLFKDLHNKFTGERETFLLTM